MSSSFPEGFLAASKQGPAHKKSQGFVLDNLLTEEECAYLRSEFDKVAAESDAGSDEPPSRLKVVARSTKETNALRNDIRVTSRNVFLSQMLWKRLKPFAENLDFTVEKTSNEDGSTMLFDQRSKLKASDTTDTDATSDKILTALPHVSLGDAYPNAGWHGDAESSTSPSYWQPHGVETRIRMVHYRENGDFFPHIDGVVMKQISKKKENAYEPLYGEYSRENREGPGAGNSSQTKERAFNQLRSVYTVLIYLSDGFEGGETQFYELGTDISKANDSTLAHRIIPKAGRCVIFYQHGVLHSAGPVTKLAEGGAGKYILRTDIMFRKRVMEAEGGAASTTLSAPEEDYFTALRKAHNLETNPPALHNYPTDYNLEGHSLNDESLSKNITILGRPVTVLGEVLASGEGIERYADLIDQAEELEEGGDFEGAAKLFEEGRGGLEETACLPLVIYRLVVEAMKREGEVG